MQRLLLIKPWHTPHKTLHRAKYNHQFSKYQNKTQKHYNDTGNGKAMSTTRGKQEHRKGLQGLQRRAETRLFLTPLSLQSEENLPPPLGQGPNLQLVTHSG